MPLKTLDVGQREGRVCYVTDEGGSTYVTVECPSEKVAYRFPWDRGIVLAGDWVSFRGQARREIVSRKAEPERLKEVPYYHDPYDGSPRDGWTYVDVRDPEGLRRVGPMDALDALKAAVEAASRHLENWYGQDSEEAIVETAGALERAAFAMKDRLAEAARTVAEKTAKTVAVDIEI